MTAGDRDIARVAEAFRRFALHECRGYSPLYEALTARVADERALLALGARAQAGQPAPNLLLAAVRFLLLGGAGHPLAKRYERVAEGGSPGEDVWPAFRDFCLRHADEIGALVASRRVQTNEVARCVYLRAGLLAGLAGLDARAVALVDVGASAGLNLLPDHYAFRYEGTEGEIAAGAPESDVVLRCALRGDGMPPTGPMPEVVARVGIDLDPPALDDEDDVRWLRALVWPDQPERERRLQAAVALARVVRPDVRTGNAADLLPGVLRSLPEDAVACVTHSSFWHQVPADDRARIDAAIAEAGRTRPLVRVAGESKDGRTIELHVSRPGDGEPRLLAGAHPHGAWIKWLAT
jgi:hypothetical protein